MLDILQSLNIHVTESLYQKDPQSSKLGKKIVTGSIELIHNIGFDLFTFRKLAIEIESTEASVYRYFESKQKVLLYLTSWYWSWMEYRLAFLTTNINSPEERLKRAVQLITEPTIVENSDNVDLGKLHQIVIEESMKAYLIKEVDHENKHGAYFQYKQFVNRISDIILEIKPNYKYPHMLVSTIVEGAHLQRYFSQHLPNLTDTNGSENCIHDFYSEIVLKALK